MKGDSAAWRTMKKYNIQDVELLEKVYLKLRPSIPNHPSVAKLRDRVGCPNCGSDDVRRNGTRVVVSSLKQRWVCHGCLATFTTGLRS